MGNCKKIKKTINGNDFTYMKFYLYKIKPEILKFVVVVVVVFRLVVCLFVFSFIIIIIIIIIIMSISCRLRQDVQAGL